ncbi:MAG: ABC transporter ATP-binding protein [Acuticoccus sp.]
MQTQTQPILSRTIDAPHQALGGGIRLGGLTKRFGRMAAVDGVSLDIAPGEFFVVLGPSGCGKSTLLRLIAGLEEADGGTIELGGNPVVAPGHHTAPEARNVAVVFQSYALWPHMSVRQNVAFPAEAAGLKRQEVAGIVDRALEAVALSPFAERKPASLSGGQQQRVALARCLASRAPTVLMDEPLANLDVHLRAAMEEELARVHATSGATTLYITHDQREAMALATRIAVMQAGRILQVDTPEAIYERPASEEVARFIGRSTLCAAEVEAVDGAAARVRVAGAAFEAACAPATRPGPATVMIRPPDVVFGADGPFAARSVQNAYRGGGFEVAVEAEGVPSVAAWAPRPVATPARFGFASGWVLPQGA